MQSVSSYSLTNKHGWQNTVRSTKGSTRESLRIFANNFFFANFFEVVICSGSFFELPLIYFFETFSDVDNISYLKNICAIKSNEPTPKAFKGTVLIIPSEK